MVLPAIFNLFDYFSSFAQVLIPCVLKKMSSFRYNCSINPEVFSMVFVWSLIISSLLFFFPPAAFAVETSIIGEDGLEMLLIPEGEFIMGLPDDEPGSSDNPLQKKYLKSFYMDRYEITNAQYKRCVAAGICKEPSLITDYPKTIHEDGKNWYKESSKSDYPVVGLTWRQAVIYCRSIGERLPLASEWEKAARGTDGRTYPWGNDWDGRKANWDEKGKLDGYKKIGPVGLFPEGASPYGIMDMAGNVWEWVDDFILKGGSWYSYPVSLRPGDPGQGPLVGRDDDIGFRCAKDFPE
jgi:eukaryotic-like serine/threonine-protein kinase